MRNGNYFDCFIPSWQQYVLTVPMRNGNFSTKLERIYRLESVLTVPMRNGNLFKLSQCLPHFSVLTVPMRNGNDAWQFESVDMQLVLTVPMRNGNSNEMASDT